MTTLIQSDLYNKKLKILCLHGYLSNPSLLNLQLNGLIDISKDIADFVFLEAPYQFSLISKEVNDDNIKKSTRGKYKWWTTKTIDNNIIYDGIEESLKLIYETQQDKGPFDIILGHSQGAALIIIYNYLTQENEYNDIDFLSIYNNKNKIDKPKLVILFNSFIPRDDIYGKRISKLSDGIDINSLHIFSSDDTVVSIENSAAVLTLYKFPRWLCLNDIGHDIPRDYDSINKIYSYIKKIWNKKFKINEVVLDD